MFEPEPDIVSEPNIGIPDSIFFMAFASGFDLFRAIANPALAPTTRIAAIT
jgi:hypothetical protein